MTYGVGPSDKNKEYFKKDAEELKKSQKTPKQAKTDKTAKENIENAGSTDLGKYAKQRFDRADYDYIPSPEEKEAMKAKEARVQKAAGEKAKLIPKKPV